MKAIISGGGSGGHIFPAVAIANAIRQRHPESDILFVGALGKMEMEKVPAAGYPIKGLPIDGLHRQLNWINIKRNIQLPYKVIKSQCMVRSILRDFNPDIVVGVGGFASEPTLKIAAQMGYPTLIQEQNSYAGLTNKILSKKAHTICVAYDNMSRFFPADKIVMTGNPVRQQIEDIQLLNKSEACQHFDISSDYPIVLSVGGSLGASSINNMIQDRLQYFCDNKIQLIWQTGSWMYQQACTAVKEARAETWVKVHQFINRMDMAYAAADVVISRAGAIAISELCIVGKPTILIPSPNVAEDHQTKNAQALVNKGAAMMIHDKECNEIGIDTLNQLLHDNMRQTTMTKAIQQLAIRGAADKIVDEIDKIIR
ncbi:MAG: undecaprenyldiphospho-muramoylpentapeptide beta-N-acetylglucosaminyltransferase [Bacteroidales bacterium]|nr:undecaprenyldiphospho-muramoylpentapeptide beta-N-acetylglucosaminyltransferase [Candidatus Colimorpha onthohippi]